MMMTVITAHLFAPHALCGMEWGKEQPKGFAIQHKMHKRGALIGM